MSLAIRIITNALDNYYIMVELVNTIITASPKSHLTALTEIYQVIKYIQGYIVTYCLLNDSIVGQIRLV